MPTDGNDRTGSVDSDGGIDKSIRPRDPDYWQFEDTAPDLERAYHEWLDGVLG